MRTWKFGIKTIFQRQIFYYLVPTRVPWTWLLSRVWYPFLDRPRVPTTIKLERSIQKYYREKSLPDRLFELARKWKVHRYIIVWYRKLTVKSFPDTLESTFSEIPQSYFFKLSSKIRLSTHLRLIDNCRIVILILSIQSLFEHTVFTYSDIYAFY